MEYEFGERDLRRMARWIAATTTARLVTSSRQPEFIPSARDEFTATGLAPRSHWLFAPVGFTVDDTSRRFVAGRLDGGDAAFDGYIAAGASVAGVVESLPFGASADRQYRVDALLEAMVDGAHHLYTRLLDNVARLVDSGARYVPYIGSPVPGRGRTGRDVLDTVESYLFGRGTGESSTPITEIGLDGSVNQGVKSATHDWILRLEDRGIRVHVEGFPESDNDLHDGRGWMGIDHQLRRMLDGRGPQPRAFDKSAQTLVCFTGHEAGSTADGDARMARFLRDALAHRGVVWACEPWHLGTFARVMTAAGVGREVETEKGGETGGTPVPPREGEA